MTSGFWSEIAIHRDEEKEWVLDLEHKYCVLFITTLNVDVNQEVTCTGLDFMGEVWSRARNLGVITEGYGQVVFKALSLG